MKFLLVALATILCACGQHDGKEGRMTDSHMKSHQSKGRFEKFLSEQSKPAVPGEIVSCMLDFYRDVRAADCQIGDGGDMLLYQWGTYDWGEGRWFELNITRQFIPLGGGDEENIFQLSVTALYRPSPALDALESGNKWCGSPAELLDFETFV
jgi:hypothetical protein